jgi:hypothetical protein
MVRKNFEAVAIDLARHVRQNWCFVPRGAVPVRLVEETEGRLRFVEDGSAVVGVFGNDNYLADAKARREVELLRDQLQQTDAEEVGFGLSQDGFSWALLVRINDQPYQTEAGRTLQKELLKISLEEIVSRAWRSACDAPGNATDSQPI